MNLELVVLLVVTTMVGMLAGTFVGAFIYHCARVGKSPLPSVPTVEGIKKAFGMGEKNEEEPERPKAQKLSC